MDGCRLEWDICGYQETHGRYPPTLLPWRDSFLLLVPSWGQRLLLEMPLEDMLGLEHPSTPVSERFVEKKQGKKWVRPHINTLPNPRKTTGVVKKKSSDCPRPRPENVL